MYKDKDKRRDKDKERQQRRRDVIKAKGVTKQGVTKEWQTVTTETSTMPNCKYCGKQLDYSILSCCYECSLKQPNRGKDIMRPLTDKDVAAMPLVTVVNKPYQMTVIERLFYRPANKLGRGETNFVSLPGRACYGVV